MITLNDFKRLIMPLRRRIFLSLGRAILKKINNLEGTQKVQINVLDGETITDLERFQEYGFETYPFIDSEAFGLFLNGNRDNGIVVCIHDRRYRPKNLSEGEVCLYTDEDATTEFRFQLKRNRIAYLRADRSQEEIDTHKYINCPEITLGSDTRLAVRKMIDERFQVLFNEHVHYIGSETTGVSTTQLTDNHMTDKTRAL